MADEAGGGVGVGRRYTSFGLGLVGVSGAIQEVGDSREESTLMSVAKPFVFALAAQSAGIERVVARVGVDPTGLPFNSAYAVERTLDGRTNPMVDAGAIATASLVPGAGLEERWLTLTGGLSTFAGRELGLDQEVLVSARRTNFRNRALAMLLRERGAIDGDPLEATELYTRGSCLRVTAVDLAVMGATLADGGVNPLTGVRVVSAEVARAALVVMAVAGLYETSGDWLLRVSVSPARAGSVAGWSRSPRARTPSGRSPRCWTARATACAVSSPPGRCPTSWAWTSWPPRRRCPWRRCRMRRVRPEWPAGPVTRP